LRLSLEAADETMMAEKLDLLKSMLGEPVEH